jgi:Xaa-Pro aminopeptidase
MYYFTGGGHVTGAVLIVKAGAPPVLYCNAMERGEAEKSGLQTIPLRNSPMEELARDPKGFLGRAELTSGRVAVLGKANAGSILHIAEKIQSQVPDLELVGEEPESSLLLYAMETKGEDEVARIRQMGKTTIEVVGKVQDYLTSRRVREDEVLLDETGEPLTIGKVKRKVALWLAEGGASDPEGCILSIGRDAGLPHSVGSPGDVLRLGQTIVFDIFPAEAGGGYFYDFTRTWCLGYADPAAQALYDEVKAAYEAVADNLDLNASFKEYNQLVCDLFHRQGHKTPLHDEGVILDGYVHSLGHGVGLNIHERPFSRPTSSDDNRLKPGVVFTIEPGLYYPEKDMGVRIEDTYWVRSDGKVERLVDYPYDLVLKMREPAPPTENLDAARPTGTA